MSVRKYGTIGAAIAAIVGGVINLEGGFTQDPRDRGNWTTGVVGQGENKGTKYGISAMAYPGVDIKNLTKEKATQLYVADYIDKPGFREIVALSPAVGEKLVDAGVNTGTARSSRWFQQSMNSLSQNGQAYPQLTVDGKLGKSSVNAYAVLQQKRGKVKACELTLKLMDSYQTQHYTSLTSSNQYLAGWLDHRIGNVPLSKCGDEI